MEYHQKLDLINLSDEEKAKFLNEISLSYVFNISISNELDYVKFDK
ncbi:hypothetical protein Q5M85_20455 [Paraclostridium bifermentans]|nr:hypothetical protein [Paraclostridium bifermentans]